MIRVRAMPTPPLDGSLDSWPGLAPRFSGAALLIGNGLSINVWPPFAYSSLFDQARTAGFTTEDRALFANTENFERVLSDLNTAIRVTEVLSLPTNRIYERCRSVQRALGQAIRAVHLTRTQVPEPTLASIRAELLRYEWTFTISYDLLVYWAMGSGGQFPPFIDLFRGGGRLEFRADSADVYVGQIPVYFLHGALHLVVSGSAPARIRMTSRRPVSSRGPDVSRRSRSLCHNGRFFDHSKIRF